MGALDDQVDGDHYKKMAIQPSEFIHKNNIGCLRGNVIKYVCRDKVKGGEKDIRKAMHYLQMILEWDYGKKTKLVDEASSNEPDTLERLQSLMPTMPQKERDESKRRNCVPLSNRYFVFPVKKDDKLTGYAVGDANKPGTILEFFSITGTNCHGKVLVAAEKCAEKWNSQGQQEITDSEKL